MPRRIDERKIVYTIEAQPEEMRIEGNASAIDDVTDKETEEWIRSQLEAGNEWAWCTVKVTATYPGLPLEGTDYLGGCSYLSESDFTQPGSYFDDMKEQAKNDLLQQIEEIRKVVCA